MAPNDAGSCEWLVGEIVHSHLLERGDLDPVVTAFQRENPYADATALAEHLVRRGFLTSFQATRLLEGQGRGLVLGPYILAETVGGGSLGTVYKAIGKADRRVIRTPPLEPGRTHYYTLQIAVERDGRRDTRTREVAFRAGQDVTVDFVEPPAAGVAKK